MNRLLLLTERSQLRLGRSLVHTIRQCADAGLSQVLVRERDLPPAARQALIAALAGIDGLTVLSSRLPDPGAAGIQLGSEQAVVTGLFGRSCHSPGDLDRAEAEGAAWATLSPYAETPSKPGYGPALDPSAFEKRRNLNVYALGGITPRNAGEALGAGADGVAVMGAVMRAEEPADVVRELLRVTR